jgi:hypothetical protein
MVSRTDLEELVAMEVQPAISIYLPTHVAGREVRQNPIRLKNLLSAAAERLGASRRPPEIDVLLSPAQRLVEDGAFWRNQQHEQQGLAIFWPPVSSVSISCRSRSRRRFCWAATFTSNRSCRSSTTPDRSGC